MKSWLGPFQSLRFQVHSNFWFCELVSLEHLMWRLINLAVDLESLDIVSFVPFCSPKWMHLRHLEQNQISTLVSLPEIILFKRRNSVCQAFEIYRPINMFVVKYYLTKILFIASQMFVWTFSKLLPNKFCLSYNFRDMAKLQKILLGTRASEWMIGK